MSLRGQLKAKDVRLGVSTRIVFIFNIVTYEECGMPQGRDIVLVFQHTFLSVCMSFRFARDFPILLFSAGPPGLADLVPLCVCVRVCVCV